MSAPAAPLPLSDGERETLERLARAQSAPHRQVVQARALLLAADGVANAVIAEEVGVTPVTVRAWRTRFSEDGLAGLEKIRDGRGRKPSIPEETIAEIVRLSTTTTPPGATHWSCRTMAKQVGVSAATVQRIWSDLGLAPHRVDTFKVSTDPKFEDKLIDVVGLYLNPPDQAIVLCMDEKSQIQALERTQPMLPMGFGYIEGVTHDYHRHGTTTLFAALNLLDGEVIAQCKPRHRHQEFLAFLRHIEANVPVQLDIHLVVDNYATHKHPKVRAWLARRPRWHIHFTPTYASWLNQVERFFALITQRAIRRGSFVSTADLVKKIDRFVRHHNETSRPFVWTATADSILHKLARLCQRISGTEH